MLQAQKPYLKKNEVNHLENTLLAGTHKHARHGHRCKEDLVNNTFLAKINDLFLEKSNAVD